MGDHFEQNKKREIKEKMRGAMTSFTHHIPVFFLNDPK